MKKILLVLLLTSTLLKAQNNDVIRTTFNNISGENLYALAIKNGVKSGEPVSISGYFKADKTGEAFGVEMDESSKIYMPVITSIIEEMQKLDPKEYLNKGEEMRYGINFKLKPAQATLIDEFIEGESVKVRIQEIYIKEFFPVKWIALDAKEDNQFAVIDEVPIPEKCKTIEDESEIRACVQKEIQKHIARKFDTGIANELGLAPGRQRVIMKFVISKEGEIVNITCSANHPKLMEEGIRVVNSIPNFYKPGMVNGKPVNVKYALPITLLVE